jgi:hypothetical protein
MGDTSSGADTAIGMPGHNAHDVITADDWDNWPDLDLFEEDPDSDPDDDEPEAA